MLSRIVVLPVAISFVLGLLQGAEAAPQQATLPRSDGSRIDWSIDVPTTAARMPLVVLAQGSGCAPALSGPSMQAARTAFTGFAALTVEKYGVGFEDEPSDDTLGCSEDYYAHHTMGQRVADYRAVLTALADAPWWDGRLVLFGGSEGGLVMARLAPQVSAVAAVLVSAAPGVSFGDIVLAEVPPEGRASVAQIFAEVRAAPDSPKRWAGYSYRFWADSLDRRGVDDMLRSKTHFLVIQGTRDAVPLATARGASDAFAAAGDTRLTYWELGGLDHGLVDAAGVSHLGSVLTLARDWVDEQVR